MLIDSHAHLNFNAYKNDLGEVIKRTLSENVWMLNVGSKYETSKKAVEIAEKFPEGVYAAIGLHPIYASDLVKIKTDPEEGNFLVKNEDFDKEKYKELAKSKKVVAIGEIGLDYYYRPKTKTKTELFKEKQRNVLCQQLDLAKELNLPIILHCRMAHKDLLEVLNFQFSIYNFQLPGVIHCFTGNWEQAKKYLEMGFYIAINGIIYKLDLSEAIRNCPLDKILIETDCPYLLPSEALAKEGLSQITRNEPIFVKYIAEEIAKIKNISFEEVSQTTFQNAKNLFNI